MSLPVTNVHITRFRSLGDLTTGPFGRVNLITGKNNAGKSSLLEAIRILVTEGSPSTFQSILNYREETGTTPSNYDGNLSPDDSTSLSSLFSNFPNLEGCSEPFTISNRDSTGTTLKSISVKIGWFTERLDPEAGRFVRTEVDLFGEHTGVPMLEIAGSNRRRVIPLDSQRWGRRPMPENPEATTPCIFLDPFSSRSTSQLGVLWDSIALTESEKQVVNALKILSPDIEAVSMIGSDSNTRPRTAIAKSRKYANPIPLRSFGDGVNRLFGIILSLSCAKGGVLLIDEIENGLHHSIQTKVWEVIFEISRRLNVQVFATSHSWDCIESFQMAAKKDPAEGILLRLSTKGDSVFSTIFSEDALQIAARDQIELR